MTWRIAHEGPIAGRPRETSKSPGHLKCPAATETKARNQEACGAVRSGTGFLATKRPHKLRVSPTTKFEHRDNWIKLLTGRSEWDWQKAAQ